MRVVLDTNVLLSALISSQGTSDTIYRAWRIDKFQLITATAQLDELRRVSRYPKFKEILPPHRIGAMVNNMQHAVILGHLPQLPKGVEINDPNDAFLFVMALVGEADYLVTGDRHAGLLQMKSAGRARIVTPAMFCSKVLSVKNYSGNINKK